MKIIVSVLCALVVSSVCAFAAVNDYLITQPIGAYQLGSPPAPMPLDEESLLKQKPFSPFSAYSTAGPLQGTGHFNVDHRDTTYRIVYENAAPRMAVKVHVTQHPGVDSDKWLLHEVEGIYRSNDQPDKLRGMIKLFGTNKILTYLKGTHYTWMSNGVVVDISYGDSQLTKPEPLEIINAYLQKFPSTLPTITYDRAHDAQWIKDEMERLLWLAGKWFALIAENDPEVGDKIKSVNSNLEDFLDFREKYYSASATNDKKFLAAYFEADDVESLGKKLAEYKAWWIANKTGSISLP